MMFVALPILAPSLTFRAHDCAWALPDTAV